MLAKIEISGTIVVETGMHIGGSSAFSAIGAVDSPVVKDTRTNQPMIPGSSLKGKLRTLLAKQYNSSVHSSADDDCSEICNLFGSAKKNAVTPSRLVFRDMFLGNEESLRKHGLTGFTEVKFENSINRVTAVANPRQIERVVRGAEFPMEIIYEVKDEESIVSDFRMIREGLTLLEFDYLGGHGSRGYGKVSFTNLDAAVVCGDVSDAVMDECVAILASRE